MINLKPMKNITPPPSYNSLQQDDERIEVLIVDEHNSTPLLQSGGAKAVSDDT